MKQAETEQQIQQNHLNMQTHSSSAGVEGKVFHDDDDNSVFHFSNAQIQMQHYETEEMKKVVAIDSQSTTSLYCNRAFVTDIRSEKEGLKLITKVYDE